MGKGWGGRQFIETSYLFPAPVANLPPRLMRSSTSAYDATPSSGSSALLPRPSSAGNLQSLPTKTSTSPVKQQLPVNPSKPGISPIRYPGQQERVQVKTRPSSGSTLTRKCALLFGYCLVCVCYVKFSV